MTANADANLVGKEINVKQRKTVLARIKEFPKGRYQMMIANAIANMAGKEINVKQREIVFV